MAFFNYINHHVAIKIVYYGPGLSGKTTNLKYIHKKLSPNSRGELVCVESDTNRTFFFDLLPVNAGLIGKYKVHFQLMTVPGQIFYEASRQSVLKGVDGIVFVADSQVPLLDANLESFDGLRRNLEDLNIDMNSFPLVFQYNKRDMDELIPVETFNNLLNPAKSPYFEASALTGRGVFETLRAIAGLTLPKVKEKILEEQEAEVFEEEEEEAHAAPAPPPPVEAAAAVGASAPEMQSVVEETPAPVEPPAAKPEEVKVEVPAAKAEPEPVKRAEPVQMEIPAVKEEPAAAPARPAKPEVPIEQRIESVLRELMSPAGSTPAAANNKEEYVIKKIRVKSEKDIEKELDKLSMQFMKKK